MDTPANLSPNQITVSRHLVIRQANENDYEAAAALIQISHEYHQAARPDIFKANPHVYSRQEFSEFLASPCPICLIAQWDQKPAGLAFGQILFKPERPMFHALKVAQLEDLSVHPKFRNQGIASELLKKAMEFSREKEASLFTLLVWSFNDTALSVYQKAGLSCQYHQMETRL